MIELLTKREQSVADLLAAGYSTREVCRILNIELCTVKTHIHNIYNKFEITDVARKRGNDPSKRAKFIIKYNAEKYGDIRLVLAQNENIKNRNLTLQAEKQALIKVLRKILVLHSQNCGCLNNLNCKNCVIDCVKEALLQYVVFEPPICNVLANKGYINE